MREREKTRSIITMKWATAAPVGCIAAGLGPGEVATSAVQESDRLNGRQHEQHFGCCCPCWCCPCCCSPRTKTECLDWICACLLGESTDNDPVRCCCCCDGCPLYGFSNSTNSRSCQISREQKNKEEETKKKRLSYYVTCANWVRTTFYKQKRIIKGKGEVPRINNHLKDYIRSLQ